MGNTCQSSQKLSSLFSTSIGAQSSLNPKRNLNYNKQSLNNPNCKVSDNNIEQSEKGKNKKNSNLAYNTHQQPQNPRKTEEIQEDEEDKVSIMYSSSQTHLMKKELTSTAPNDDNAHHNPKQTHQNSSKFPQNASSTSPHLPSQEQNNHSPSQKQKQGVPSSSEGSIKTCNSNMPSPSPLEGPTDPEKQRMIDKIQHKHLTINSFVIERSLGQGAFGQVSLVRKVVQEPQPQSHGRPQPQQPQPDQQLYAMKSISKKDLVNLNLVEATLLEKKILQRNNSRKHPFLVELKYSFQSKSKVYFVMEHVPCGDLYKLLQRVVRFTEEQARFILAETVLALEHLHTRLKIIYRDLKPENVLLTKDGHVKLSDFGLSIQFKKESDLSFTFAGTPEYLAPEVILKTGHNKNVDLWGLGIFLYELLRGSPPFTDNFSQNRRNFARIQQLILQNKPKFPYNFSLSAVDLIQKLLVNEQNNRLGANDFNQIKQHVFFQGVDWEAMLALKVPSPLKPLLNNNGCNNKNGNSLQQKQQHLNYKPRPIYETPNQSYPNISGISYNPDTQLDNGLSSGEVGGTAE